MPAIVAAAAVVTTVTGIPWIISGVVATVIAATTVVATVAAIPTAVATISITFWATAAATAFVSASISQNSAKSCSGQRHIAAAALPERLSGVVYRVLCRLSGVLSSAHAALAVTNIALEAVHA